MNDTLIFEIPFDKVAHIIGSRGLVIQDIQTRSAAKAYINQEFPPGVNRQMHLSGRLPLNLTSTLLLPFLLMAGCDDNNSFFPRMIRL
ncbi:hypothetical protein EON65_40575 [archaeon]|nr:MAG: hypothetical protein EON65_40575 [archaeon]